MRYIKCDARLCRQGKVVAPFARNTDTQCLACKGRGIVPDPEFDPVVGITCVPFVDREGDTVYTLVSVTENGVLEWRDQQ